MLIAGTDPVGLTAAANLVHHGVPVTVLEAGQDLSTESRALPFHSPTLDMLDDLGVVQPLIAEGLVTPQFQYRSRADSVVAAFDFSVIADATHHPYRLQCEQSKLTRILRDRLRGDTNFRIEYSCPIREVTQSAGSIEVDIDRDGKTETRRHPWVIGADGARSNIRHALGIAFDGFTWPDRYLVVSTPFDFAKVTPDLAPVSYVADPDHWFFLLQISGLWRVMFRIAAEKSDELALSPGFRQQAGVRDHARDR